MLKEYPAVRVKLEAIAVRRLEKHKLPLSEIGTNQKPLSYNHSNLIVNLCPF